MSSCAISRTSARSPDHRQRGRDPMGLESSANWRRLLWLQTVMNARAVVGVVGAVTLLLGLLGLFRPEWAMNFLGYAVASNAPATFVRGEVRAVYGGLMMAAAVFT